MIELSEMRIMKFKKMRKLSKLVGKKNNGSEKLDR